MIRRRLRLVASEGNHISHEVFGEIRAWGSSLARPRADFRVLFVFAFPDGEKELVHPRLRTTKCKLPDEGFHVCEKEGNYIFEFDNISTLLFSIKLQHIIVVV